MCFLFLFFGGWGVCFWSYKEEGLIHTMLDEFLFIFHQMDTALQSVMIESSIDYSSKFERLAEHLADNTDASQPNM